MYVCGWCMYQVRNSRVGTQFRRGISGGEKKRLSVGCELITDPSLIFLDEPTTGLDAYNSLCVMDMLNDLCREGRTVIWYVQSELLFKECESVSESVSE
jgi:ABC-type multidrug transport system ATPase subunit